MVSGIAAAQAKTLRRIFDIGFEYDPRNRWQSAAALNAEITMLNGLPADSPDFETRLEDLRARISKSGKWSDHERFKVLEQELKQRCVRVGKFAHQQLAGRVNIIPGGSACLTRDQDSYPLILSYTIEATPGSKQFHLYHTCRPIGSELVLYRNESLTNAGFFGPDLHTTEVLRVGLFDPEAVARIVGVVESTLIETLATMFDVN